VGRNCSKEWEAARAAIGSAHTMFFLFFSSSSSSSISLLLHSCHLVCLEFGLIYTFRMLDYSNSVCGQVVHTWFMHLMLYIHHFGKSPQGVLLPHFNIHMVPDLVAKGLDQKAGMDYDKTCTPAIKHSNIVFSLASTRKWSLHQLDVRNAFFMGFLIKMFT